MSETMNNIFGRARNDLPAADEQAAAATATQEPLETHDTNVIDAEQADGPSAEDVADDTATTEDAEPTEAESTDDADDTADEDAAPVTVVPVTVESADAPVEPGDAAVVPVAVETVAAAEVEARPAAGARGNTTVGDGVVSKVVNMVAGKVDGVHRLDEEGSSVAVDAGVVTITIALVVEYGHAVRALAEQLRVDVIDAVEQFLGLDVAAVDVHVSDIHHPESV